MRRNINSIASVLLLTFGVASCANESIEPEAADTDGKVAMSFTFSHPSETRATETSFEEGDAVGLFVVESDTPLEISGNVLNNEHLTFSVSGWNSGRKLYWDKGTYNAYAYYPALDEIFSVSDLPFSVATDQRESVGNSIDGYEGSDFLYASSLGIEASPNPVNLQFRHILSKLTVRLIKGEDFEGEIPDNATVYIHNTVTDATIDLAAGVATKNLRGAGKTVIARKAGPTSYTAIIVPQRLENRVPLVEVVMNGVSFLYESKFLFKPGIHHIVNLVVDKNPEQVKIEVGGEITDWN